MQASKDNPIYTVYIIINGSKYDLTPAVNSVDLNEAAGQLAQTATISVMNVQIGGVWLTSLLRKRCRIFIYANDGSKQAEVLRGNVWERPYVASLTDRELTLKCYDDLKYFLESEDADYFSAGKTTKDILTTLCNKWGVELDYQYESITHAKLALRGTLGDIVIADLLDQVKNRTGKNYVFIQTEGKFVVRGIGQNTAVPAFCAGENAIRTNTKMELNQMVTKVIIYGKAEDDESRAPVEAIVTGNTEEYGTMQRVIVRDENTSLEDAKETAKALINEKGDPKWEYEVRAIDYPWLRKGDKVYVNAGDIQDKYLIVEDIDRSITNKKKEMTLTLSVDGSGIGKTTAEAESERENRQSVVDIMKGWMGGNGHQKVLDIYNGQDELPRGYSLKSSDAWCAAAVSAAFIEAGLEDIAPSEVSCSQMISKYKEKGRWEESDSYVPTTGDIIMYDWQDGGSGDNQGTPDHVGIVVSVSGSTITVIEGNNNGSVGYRTVQINGKGIRGYCLPDYSSKSK